MKAIVSVFAKDSKGITAEFIARGGRIPAPLHSLKN